MESLDGFLELEITKLLKVFENTHEADWMANLKQGKINLYKIFFNVFF